MEPYILISDPHLHAWSAFSKTTEDGTNNRLEHIMGAFREARDYADKHDIKHLRLGGDTFHTRGVLKPSVLNPVTDLFRELTHSFVSIEGIPGNHDLESNDACRLSSSATALERVGVEIHNTVGIDLTCDLVMVPWFASVTDVIAKLEDCKQRLENNGRDASEFDALIHAPVNGVILGIPDHGLYAKELGAIGFRRVFAGHYHDHKDMGHGVYSIGALTHQTWNDVNTKAGFVVVTETDVKHIATSAPEFIDLDGSMSDEDMALAVAGNYARVKLGEATEGDIKAVREELYNMGALGVQVLSTPKSKVVQRSTSVSAGASIEASVSEFVKHKAYGDDEFAKKVNSEALDVLSEADSQVS